MTTNSTQKSNNSAKTPLELIKISADFLKKHGVQSPRLDAEILLCAVLNVSRIQLYSREQDRPLTEDELAGYRKMIARRAQREPVSRILGEREFMGLTFKLTPAVFDPRPETELLVEELGKILGSGGRGKPGRWQKIYSSSHFAQLDKVSYAAITALTNDPAEEASPDTSDNAQPAWLKARRSALIYQDEADDLDVDDSEYTPVNNSTVNPEINQIDKNTDEISQQETDQTEPAKLVQVLDVCTGSGCIAIALAAFHPEWQITATDISADALTVAKENAIKNNVAEQIRFLQGDLLLALEQLETASTDLILFDAIVSNPPYIEADCPTLWPEVAKYDPPTALYAGADGLDIYKEFIPQALSHLAPGGVLLLELGAGQLDQVAGIALRAGFTNVNMVRDHAGIERILIAFAR